MKVLYADHKHDLSGGPKSLITTLKVLENHSEIFPFVVVDPKSYLAEKFTDFDIPVMEVRMNRENFNPSKETTIHQNPKLLLENIPVVTSAIYQLSKIIFQNDIDLMHTNSFKSSLLCTIVSEITRTPFVHHARISSSNADHGWLDRVVFNCADGIIYNSRFTKSTFEPNSNSFTQIIYPPVSKDKFYPEQVNSCLSNEPGINRETKKVGMIARIEPRKRYIDLIRAAPEVLSEIPGTNFILVGGTRDGKENYLDELKNEAKKLGVYSNIHFLGRREDVPELMNSMDVTVLPSRHEPFGKVALESILTATPVIVSDEGGLKEIVKHESGGTLIPTESPGMLAKAILKFLRNDTYAKKVAKRGRERVIDKFSVHNNITRKIEFYRKLIDNN